MFIDKGEINIQIHRLVLLLITDSNVTLRILFELNDGS